MTLPSTPDEIRIVSTTDGLTPKAILAVPARLEPETQRGRVRQKLSQRILTKH